MHWLHVCVIDMGSEMLGWEKEAIAVYMLVIVVIITHFHHKLEHLKLRAGHLLQLFALSMVVIQHAFIHITVTVLLLLNNLLDYLWGRLLNIHNFLSNNRLGLGRAWLWWTWLRDRSFSLDLNLDLFLFEFRAQIDGMPG